jgi:hypothetical protein
MALRLYLRHLGVSLTQLLNATLGGWPDESVSSRLWRLSLRGSRAGVIGVAVVDTLFFWERDHCFKSYESERQRQQLPPGLRQAEPKP